MYKDIKNWKVLTPTGFSTFEGVEKITHDQYCIVTFSNNSTLTCSLGHKLLLENKKCSPVIDLSIGTKLANNLDVIDIEVKNESIELYEFINVEKEHLYYTNDVVSKNCAAITHMGEIWAAAGLTLTKSGGKCIGISCVTEDTFVFTDKGPQQIKEFTDPVINDKTTIEFNKPYKVLGKDKFREGTLFHYNGITDIYKLSTSYSELKGSSEHKLWVYDNLSQSFKWKKLKEITTEDWVNVSYNQQVWGDNDDVSDFNPIGRNKNKFRPKELTPDICYLLGLYISEGSAHEVIRKGKVVGGSLCVSCGDDVSDVFNSLGLKFSKSESEIGHITHNYELIQFLQYLGFNLKNKAPQKEIPTRLFSMSKKNIKALLQGMFDGDGSSNSTNGNCCYSSSSEKLIDQTRVLLMNFGVLSCKYKTTKDKLNANLPKEWCKFTTDSFSLQIYTKNAKNYYSEIGFRFNRKNKNKSKLKETKSYNELPGNKQIVNSLYELSTISPWKLAIYDKVYIAKNENHSSVKVKQLIDIIIKKKPSLINNQYIKNIQDTVLLDNSVWVRVKSIDVLPKKEKVYDFSLPETNDFWCHSVIYNGILGHQTPTGKSGWYFEQYTNAEENGWNIIEAHWGDHPDYKLGMYQWVKDDEKPEGGYIKFYNEGWPDVSDAISLKKYATRETYNYIRDGKLRSPWYDYESKRLGIQKTRCELDCSFAGSGSEVLDPEVIRGLEMLAKDHPPFTADELGVRGKGLWKSYKQFKDYNPDHGYILSADAATGDGSDYSAFVVLDMTTREIVATYKEQLDPLQYAKIIKDVAVTFGGCLVIVEYQGPGLTVLLELKGTLRYHNIYHHTLKKNEVTKNQKRKIGFWQGESTRTLGGDRLEEVLNTGELKVYSTDFIAELHTWIWDKDGKRRHAPDKHDDLIMATTNAMFYVFYVITKRANANDMMKKQFGRVSIGSFDTNGMIDYNELLNDDISENKRFKENGEYNNSPAKDLKNLHTFKILNKRD